MLASFSTGSSRFLPHVLLIITYKLTNVLDSKHEMATASSSSNLSSPSSFVTAHDATLDKSTAASSPVHENPCPYRDARQLPRDLKAHCQILLEEQLCMLVLAPLNGNLHSQLDRWLRDQSPQ